jgi:hypothetical protein
MNRFEAQGLSGNFEFEADQEFEGTQFENAQFGEAEFGDAEFNGGELEGEWDGEVVRDHRRRRSPTAAPRVRDHRRPAAYRSGYRPSQRSSRSRSYAAPRSTRWGTRTSYGSRPSYRSSYSPRSRSSYRPWSRSSYGQPGQRYRWGQPGLTSGWYRGGRYPGRYWRFGQGQRFPGATSQWGSPQSGYWDRWGRWRRRYPYGRYGTGGSAYGQPSYGEPTEPPYEEPPMPPPVIVAAPPPPPPMAEPPAEPPMAEPDATTPPTPPAQGQAPSQAPSEEFFIEPEAFEFEPELDEYENGWGELESGFGEFEGGRPPPAPSTLSAPPVDKNPVSGCETAGRPFDDFQFRSSTVPARHGPRIKELAKIIVNSWVNDPSLGIRTVCLEGHTDNVGPADANMRLGLARAKNLRAKLKQAIFDEAKKTGFGQQITDSVTILVSSRGKADPVAPNTTSLGRRRNRRVRFAFST